ncbi:hypothetical protein GOODEAATRI_011754 [Goodea atripinnis]|uniref:Uncharacterized protein n=1 Tax=Goodea atripinnis TaxID=208336 RepID=A0ABV0N0K7_9TELE
MGLLKEQEPGGKRQPVVSTSVVTWLWSAVLCLFLRPALTEFLILPCRSDHSGDRVLNSIRLFCVMLKRVTGTTPCLSSHESYFHSYLQPCVSKITLWKHHNFAHLPVHPPTPGAEAQQFRDHKERTL